MFFDDTPMQPLLDAIRAAMGAGRVVVDDPVGRFGRTQATVRSTCEPVRTSATRHLLPIEPRPDREEDEHVHHVESVTRPDSKGRHEERCACGMVRSVYATNAESGKHWRGEWRRA